MIPRARPKAAVPKPPRATVTVPKADASPPRPPRPPRPKPPKTQKPSCEECRTAEDFWTYFDGRGKDEDNPIPLDVFFRHFPPKYGDGRDIPTDVWVQNRHGIIYRFVSTGGRSRTNIVRSRLKPVIPMNYREGEDKSELGIAD